MAAEAGVAVSIFTWIGGYLVTPIARRFHYLTRFNENVEMLRNELQNLCNERHDVQQEVNDAERNGREIKKQVQKWLGDMDRFINEVERLLVNEIESNESGLHGWHADWRLRYKLGKQARRILKSIWGRQGAGSMGSASVSLVAPPKSVDLMPVSVPAPPPGIEAMSTKDFVAFASTKSTMHLVIEALKDENCNIIGLYGMGGVGKTTLVKEVGKQVKESKLFDQVVMAVVSQNPDLRKIQGQIADMLGLTFVDETEPGRAARLKERLKNEKSILVILDDIWKRLDLEAVGIPHGHDEHKGCKIILTSRLESICDVMGTQTKKIPVGVLTEQESWDLFKKIVGTDIDSSSLNVVAREIVGRCRGLPLALVLVGSALREKELDEWKAAARQLAKSKTPDIEGVDKDVYSCVRLSYDYLQGEKYKLSFLLCCLFPEDYDIPIEDLARYGMGMRWFADIDSVDDARSEAQRIVRHLKSSSMLLDGGEKDYVRMHDVVRDVAISIASEGEGKHKFFVRAGAGLKEWPEMETVESCTSISLIENDIRELPKGLVLPRLQILLLGENNGNEAVPDNFFNRMEKLRVLDLSVTWVDRSLIMPLPSSIEFLTNLQTLRLEKCLLCNVSVLGTLNKLEILSLSGSKIEELPEELGKLTNFRLLDLSWCYRLKRIPANVLSKLSRLEELYMGGTCSVEWKIEGTSDERGNACLSELKLLPRLTILGIDLWDIDCFPKTFHLPNLQKFEISIGESCKNRYPKSKELFLRNVKAPLADGVKDFIQMVEYLRLSHLNSIQLGIENILAVIGEGQNGLKHLAVNNCAFVKSLIDMHLWKPLSVFANLEELYISWLSNLTTMCHGLLPDGSLQKLRVLKVHICDGLSTIVPANLVYCLKKLEKVEVESCKKVEVVFQLDDIVVDKELRLLVLSSLRILYLSWLPKLFAVWNGSRSPASLHNLTKIKIKFCDKLRYLFPICIAQSLSQLETLDIDSCGEMETIIEEDEEGASKDPPIQTVAFPKLKFIEVSRCGGMKSLFKVVIAGGLQQLEELNLCGNDKMSTIISHKERGEEECADKEILLLPKLSRLEVSNMQNLERLCPESFTMELPSLKELVVEYRHKMTYFAVNAATYGLKSAPNLEKVNIDGETLSVTAIQKMFVGKIYQMESRKLHLKETEVPLGNGVKNLLQIAEDLTLFKLKGGSGGSVKEGPSNILPEVDEKGLNSLKILEVIYCTGIRLLINMHQWEPRAVFENLEELHLQNLHNLTTMCDDLLPNGSLQKLRVLTFKRCSRLSNTIPANMVYRVNQLEEVQVEDCESVAVIFQLEDFFADKEPSVILSGLRKLKLRHLSDLVAVWDGPSSFVSLHNLVEVEIVDCNKLGYLFPSSLAQSLVQLGTLKIRGCNNLETIIAEDEEGPPIQPVAFPKLKVIKVISCNKLGGLFTFDIARGLQQLEELVLFGNKGMTKIISHKERGEEEGVEKEILIPKLTRLCLDRLPNMQRLCPESFTLELPFLKELLVQCCSMMKYFSVNAAVYGLKSAPHLERVCIDYGTRINWAPLTTLTGTATQNIFKGKIEESEEIQEIQEIESKRVKRS